MRMPVKRLASILLAFCFFLPLSECTTHKADGTPVVSRHYGVEMAADSWESLIRADHSPLKSAMGLLLALVVFFAPLASAWLPQMVQAGCDLAAALIALWFLAIWVFVFGSPQYGGLLAMTCWLVLLTLSCHTLWRRLKAAWKARRLPAAPSAQA
jgi:hypothetical protein